MILRSGLGFNILNSGKEGTLPGFRREHLGGWGRRKVGGDGRRKRGKGKRERQKQRQSPTTLM